MSRFRTQSRINADGYLITYAQQLDNAGNVVTESQVHFDELDTDFDLVPEQALDFNGVQDVRR